MNKTRFLSQTLVKRTAAAAISNAQARNNWSKSEVADALGCCPTTIRNRLDGDDPGKQVTIHELLRSVQSDGPHIANEIFQLVDHKVLPLDGKEADQCDRKKASSITRANLAVSIMLEDDRITDEEIRGRRQELEAGRDAFDALLSRIKPSAVA